MVFTYFLIQLWYSHISFKKISFGIDAHNRGSVKTVFYKFWQALWEMSLGVFIFRDVVGYKSAASLKGDS